MLQMLQLLGRRSARPIDTQNETKKRPMSFHKVMIRIAGEIDACSVELAEDWFLFSTRSSH